MGTETTTLSSALVNAADLLDRVEESITIYDRDARFVYLNAAALRPFGQPILDVIGKRPWDLVGAADAPNSAFRVALEGVLAGGPPTTTTTFVAAFDRWYEVEIHPHPLGAFASARDVTAARIAHDDLARSEARYRAMIEFAPEAIVIVDLSTLKFCEANPAAAALFGRTRAELLTLGPADLATPSQPGGVDAGAALADSVQRVLDGSRVEMEWSAFCAGGQVLLLELHAQRLPGSNPVLVRTSMFDITRRKRAEEQLAQVQRLEAVARLAGGVAHDFNNMLTVILGGTEFALHRLPPLDPSRAALEDVISCGERASLITRQLLAFGRKQPLTPRVVDLSSYVEGALPVLNRLVGEDVTIELDLARPLGGALLDLAHVEQIVINLVANARDAMPRGGTMTIQTANVFLDGEYQRLHNGVPPGRYVLLSIADTGEGIPAAIQPHIFEPFFTTKELDRGTGLGLATVHGIVKHNGGHIWVYSEPGLGATFKIYFPLTKGAVDAEEIHLEGTSTRFGGTETVLLVEDEGLVRAFLRRTLQQGGYAVLEASNAGEALLVCEQHEGAIDLLVTDVVMPRMTGPQLGARLRKVRNDMRIIYVSGYSEERLERPDGSAAHDAFLAKPMTAEALLRCVRGVPMAAGRDSRNLVAQRRWQIGCGPLTVPSHPS